MYLTHDDLDLVVSIGCHRLQMVRGYIYSSVLIRQKDRTHSRCDTTDDSNLSTESSVTVSVFYKNLDIGRIPILNMKLITVLRSKFLVKPYFLPMIPKSQVQIQEFEAFLMCKENVRFQESKDCNQLQMVKEHHSQVMGWVDMPDPGKESEHMNSDWEWFGIQ